MNLIFTDYVRALQPGRPEPPIEAAWAKLRDALHSEMRKLALTVAPPCYLGVFGRASWSDPEAFDELLIDCFSCIFIRRLQGLKALLETTGNIEGLVFRCIRNFLYDAQKKHDPLGFRVFDVLRTATRRVVADGTLQVLEGDPKIKNDTVLSFVSDDDPVPRGGDLNFRVRAWNDDLLPELVTARGRALDPIVWQLATHLARLEAQGIALFQFRDVVEPLKYDVRARWSAIWSDSEGETAFEDCDDEFMTIVRLARPDFGVEEREAFEGLLGCVAEALARLDTTPKIRGYLSKLWTFLRNHFTLAPDDKLPSRRKIARQLDIPRYRFPDLYAGLGRLVGACRSNPRRPDTGVQDQARKT